jgi:hypothetical protein
MIRGFCLAVDGETGKLCGAGQATYIETERGCTVCARHYWEAVARRELLGSQVPESAGDRLALRLKNQGQADTE